MDEGRSQLPGILAREMSSYLPVMVTLHIEHPITDFETWAGAFARFEGPRCDAGVRSHRVQRPLDDPHYVLVDLDFDDAEAAHSFCDFLHAVVWAVPENAPALAGEPKTVVLQTESV